MTAPDTKPDLELAEWQHALRAIIEPSPWGKALRRTIRERRAHPGLYKAFISNEGTRTADGLVLDNWKHAHAVWEYLTTVKVANQDQALEQLLTAAARYMEDVEPQMLKYTWAWHQQTGLYKKLPLASRRVTDFLFARALVKGPRVLESYRSVVYGIELMTGRTYRPETLYDVHPKLLRHGIADIRVGQQYQPGRRARPTEYNILPAAIRDQLSPLNPTMPYVPDGIKGIVGLLYPAMTDEQHDLMERKYRELRRKRVEDNADAGSEFSPLIDGSDLAVAEPDPAAERFDELVSGAERDVSNAERYN